VKPLRLHPDARAELDEAFTRYAAFDTDVASRWLSEYSALASDISANPGLGSPGEIQNARVRIFRSFPYSIHYIELSDHIVVMAIAHYRRRPGYWRRREGP